MGSGGLYLCNASPDSPDVGAFVFAELPMLLNFQSLLAFTAEIRGKDGKHTIAGKAESLFDAAYQMIARLLPPGVVGT